MIFEQEKTVIGTGVNKNCLHVILPQLWCKYNKVKRGDKVRIIITDESVIVVKDKDKADQLMTVLGMR